MMDPRRLEAYADQEWVATRALGMRAPAAQSMQRTRQLAALRNTGRRDEKFDEDSKRVIVQQPHPGVNNLLGERKEESLPGVPPVQYQELLSGPLAHAWGPYKYKPEYFSVNHTRGVALETLDIDPGPLYAVVHGPAYTPGPASTVISAPSLLSVTRAVHAAFGGVETGTEGIPASAGMQEATSSSAVIPPAAGSSLGVTLEMNTTQGRLGTMSRADIRYQDGSQPVGKQYAGATGREGAAPAAVDVTLIGRQTAIVTARGRSEDGQAQTVAGDHGRTGAVLEDGVGAPGASQPAVHSVVHPMEAFPAMRRLLNDEACAQMEAERFRRRIVSQAVRRQVVTQAAHPHGVLGVDSQDNEDSAVYGELACTRRQAREARSLREAHREAVIQGSTRSDARRGYDILRHEHGAGGADMAVSARIAPGGIAADPAAARADGAMVRTL